jgi:antitoxin PrlF
MITSRLTSKAQTTIPKPVRAALHLGAGDELVYEIQQNTVILRKASHGKGSDDPGRVSQRRTIKERQGMITSRRRSETPGVRHRTSVALSRG